MSSRTQTTEVFLWWKYVRQAVGRALCSLLLNSLLSERLRYSDTSHTHVEEQRPKRRTLRNKTLILLFVDQLGSHPKQTKRMISY